MFIKVENKHMDNTRNINILRGANLIALIATLVMNGLSNSGIFPTTITELGNGRPIFFLPEAYVFAIWGVIYTLLIGFSIYQFRPVAIKNGSVAKVGWWFVVSCLANMAWLTLFLFDLVWLSTVAMLVILFALGKIYTRLEIGHRQVDWQENWAVLIPFSVYLGWISVATVANFTAALYESGSVTNFLGIGSDIWAVVMMAIAGVLGLAMLIRRSDIAYALVIVWALIGINLRSFDTELYQVLAGLNADWVNTGAFVVAIIVSVGIMIRVGVTLQSSFKTTR